MTRNIHKQICCNLKKHRVGNAMRSVKKCKGFFWKFVSFYEFLKNWLRLFDRIRTLQLDQQGDRGNILCQNWEPPGRNRGLCRSDMVIIILLHQACQDSIVNFTHFQAAYGQVDWMHIYLLGISLSKDVFERCTSTGSVAFFLSKCLKATKFVFVSVFSLRDDLPENLVNITPQDCIKITSSWRSSFKIVVA